MRSGVEGINSRCIQLQNHIVILTQTLRTAATIINLLKIKTGLTDAEVNSALQEEAARSSKKHVVRSEVAGTDGSDSGDGGRDLSSDASNRGTEDGIDDTAEGQGEQPETGNIPSGDVDSQESRAEGSNQEGKKK